MIGTIGPATDQRMGGWPPATVPGAKAQGFLRAYALCGSQRSMLFMLDFSTPSTCSTRTTFSS